MKLMLDCRALARLLSQSQDDTLPPSMQRHMRLHMLSCQACRNVDDQMSFVRSAMKRLQLDAASDLTLKKRSK